MPLLDSSYRLLFNHRQILSDLLQVILPLSLFKQLNIRQARSVSPVYVGPALQARQGDLAWHIPSADNSMSGLLIGIEHQSRSDPYMVFRAGTYKHLQIESFLKHAKQRSSLPIPIILVLYSGKPAWTAPVQCTSFFSTADYPLLLEHIPQQTYWLIDLKKHTMSRSLQEPNLFLLFCQLQHNQGLAHVSALLQTALNTCQDQTFLRDLAAWINQLVLPRCLPHLTLPHHVHLKDIRAMLEDNSDSWLHQWESQGIQKGLVQGLQQGRRQAQQNTLIRQIRHKFGRLPRARHQQLIQASSRQLAVWSLLVLDAATLDDLFHAGPSASS